MKNILTLLAWFIAFNISASENIDHSKTNPELLNNHWSAYWIASPEDAGLEFGVYHFRKDLELVDVPDEFIVHVSADNRYQLFVNGERVCFGPSRGDLMNWKFESIDVSKHLVEGIKHN